MPIAKANDIEIAYEAAGDSGGEPVVLICGFAASLAWWDDDFVQRLVDRGCFVIRFDNRDTGHSSRLESPYSLHEMAADIAGLLDHLNIERAHLVGVSMGGMIAQTFAIDFPDRIGSLCSIMSAPYSRGADHLGPEVLALFTQPAPRTSDEFAEIDVHTIEVVGSKGLPVDWDGIRRRAVVEWERGRPTHGVQNQLAAIHNQDDRWEALAAVKAPTLVVHGTVDPLMLPEWGEATAKAVPGVRLLMMEGMGHDLPPVVWPQVVDAIIDNLHRHP